jgi:hypothetical protein
MAVNDVYRLSVDWTLADQVTSPVSGRPAFIPSLKLVGATGTAIGTASNPLVVSSSSGGAGGASTGTLSSVDSSTGDATILAANANRKGASVFNTDANALYLLLSTGTASATNLSVSVAANGYYEVPFGYTGIIKGTWAADGAGAAKVTEFS